MQRPEPTACTQYVAPPVNCNSIRVSFVSLKCVSFGRDPSHLLATLAWVAHPVSPRILEGGSPPPLASFGTPFSRIGRAELKFVVLFLDGLQLESVALPVCVCVCVFVSFNMGSTLSPVSKKGTSQRAWVFGWKGYVKRRSPPPRSSRG